jgi:hypothetical protein
VGAQWRPCTGCGPTSQATMPSRAPQSQTYRSLAPLLLPRPLQARAEHRGAIAAAPLPHARAPSSLVLGSIPPISNPAASPSTTSTRFRECLSEGEATLLTSTATAVSGTSPEFEVAVARAAPPFSSLPFPLVSFPVTPGSFGAGLVEAVGAHRRRRTAAHLHRAAMTDVECFPVTPPPRSCHQST